MPTQSFEIALKEFKKEKATWKAEQSKRERQQLQLSESNKVLTEKNKKLEVNNAKLSKVNDDLKAKQAEIGRLEAQQDGLEAQVADKVTELADTRQELAKAKQTVDKELEEYSTTHKQAIKKDILATNIELETVKIALIDIQTIIDERKSELAELNQTTIDLQDDIKLLEADKRTLVAENASQKTELETTIKDLQEKYDELGFKYNDALITMKKAEEQNKKFQEYEKQARKLLDIKDRELQNREADMAQESVFIKNRRSNLPAM